MTQTSVTNPVLLLTGATGQIGQRLLIEWCKLGHKTVLALRNPDRQWPEIKLKLQECCAPTDNIVVIKTDFSKTDFGWGPDEMNSLSSVTCVAHLAALWGWNLNWCDADNINVQATIKLHGWASERGIPGPFVTACGFMSQVPGHLEKMGLTGADVDWEKASSKWGVYETSKMKSYLSLHPNSMKNHPLPVTWIHPAVVIADNAFKEVPEHSAIAGIIRSISKGQMLFIPGSRQHIVPWVTGEYVAKYAVSLLLSETNENHDHLLLDPNSPSLFESAKIISKAIGATAPIGHAPLSVFSLLLGIPFISKLLNTSKESLSFIINSPPNSSTSLAWAHSKGISHPPIKESLEYTAIAWGNNHQ